MTRGIWIAVLGLVVCTTGCDPYGHVEGVVVSKTSAPVAGATVHLHCASSGVDRTVSTDAAGRFATEGIAVGPPFTVEISKPGFVTRTVTASDVCFAEGIDTKCAKPPNVVLSEAP